MVRRTALVLMLLTVSGCSHDIKLRVIDADSGEPMPKATVDRMSWPYDLLFSPMLDRWGPRQTGADGRIDVRVHGDGTKYKFAVDALDYARIAGLPRIEQADTFVIDWRGPPGPVSTSRPNADGVLDVSLSKKR